MKTLIIFDFLAERCHCVKRKILCQIRQKSLLVNNQSKYALEKFRSLVNPVPSIPLVLRPGYILFLVWKSKGSYFLPVGRIYYSRERI